MNEKDLFGPLEAGIKDQLAASENVIFPTKSYWQNVWFRFRSKRLAILGLYMLAGIIFMAICGPFLSLNSNYDMQLDLKNLSPGAIFWFGTDELGRDLFTRCWLGARISLFVGITASCIDLIIGVLYGSIAGFSGGKIDEWMMRIADIFHTIPYLLIVILLTVIIGTGIFTVIIAITITGWINMARIVRMQILQIKQQDFIIAARALGASRRRILLRHLIPNSMGPIIVTLTFTVPTAIFAEAFLSFLGLGVQSPFVSWGTIALDGLAAMRFYPWRLFIPAALVCVTMLSLNLLGDGLRDALDTRLENKSCGD